MTKSKRGGKRNGTGRKPKPPDTRRRTLSISFSPEVIAYLNERPNRSRATEAAIRASAGFQEWVKKGQTK